jgi:MoaA/NifB/PqqE/SkfB family radical SAM enzyme
MTTRFPLPTSEIHVWVCYLTARCNFACDYCIQKPGMVPGQRRKPWGRYQELTGRQWVEALNAFPVRPEHPLILTGGEPSLHPDFTFVASHLEGYELDMTSNLTFDVARLAREMQARGKRFKTSFHTYHPKFMAPERFVEQALALRDSGVVEAPVFSMVNLDRFPHFRDDEHARNVRAVLALAERRGLAYQFNEFRGVHLGAPYDRTRTRAMECTSAWVNIAPDGEIYNCQYHLTVREHSFGNVTRIDACRPQPGYGTFFACTDFGMCDPCHENSGHGAFRDASGQVFRRTASDARVYLRLMEPAAIQQVARRYFAEGQLEEARVALLAALGRPGSPAAEDPETWADLGVTLHELGAKAQSLAALLHAIELGRTQVETLASALVVAKELGRLDAARAAIAARVGQAGLEQVEQALAATLLDPPREPTAAR